MFKKILVCLILCFVSTFAVAGDCPYGFYKEPKSTWQQMLIKHPDWQYLDPLLPHPAESPNPEWKGAVHLFPKGYLTCGAGKCG